MEASATPSVSVAVVYHSGYGHTARQAGAVARGAGAVAGVTAHSLPVSSLDEQGWATLAAADAIIFGSPTYMGGPAAAFQVFAEASSPIWQRQGWKDKIAAGFTNSAGVNGDKQHTLTSFAVLAAQHGMHWVNLGLLPGWLASTGGSIDDLNRLGSFLGAMAQSPADAGPDEAPSAADLATAAHLGRRVAEVAVALCASRSTSRPALVA